MADELSNYQKSCNAIFAADESGQFGYAIELAKRHLKTYRRDAKMWIRLASTLGRFSRYEEAEVAFNSAVTSGSDEMIKFIYAEKGHMYKRQGNYREAERWYRKAIELNLHCGEFYTFLGVLFFRDGDLISAEETLRSSIAVDAEYADEAYFNLGGVLTAQERYKEALECYQKAIELDPEYEIAKKRLADVEKILAFKDN